MNFYSWGGGSNSLCTLNSTKVNENHIFKPSNIFHYYYYVVFLAYTYPNQMVTYLN